MSAWKWSAAPYRVVRRSSRIAGGEVDVALLADGILRAVAVGIVVRVVEQRVHGLVAAQVYDAENLSPLKISWDPRFAESHSWQ